MNRNKAKIFIGKGAKIDDGVKIGYMPTREIPNLDLKIGDKAIIRSGTVIYLGSNIGSHLETGHNVVIREENRIGDHFHIWNNSVVDYGCIIGNKVSIHCNVYIAQYTVIEDEVFLAPGVTIANDIHPGCPDSRRCMRGPTIKKGAQIGVNVTILPFITIGEYALIGAGSVVTKDIPPYTVAFGNPAKVYKKISELKCVTKLRDKPYNHINISTILYDELKK